MSRNIDYLVPILLVKIVTIELMCFSQSSCSPGFSLIQTGSLVIVVAIVTVSFTSYSKTIYSCSISRLDT